jgi:RNA polymerase sigma-70 factor (ECF subfamily)
VAETYAIAWRRVRELPPGEEVQLWLYGVARRVLANHYRERRDAGRGMSSCARR